MRHGDLVETLQLRLLDQPASSRTDPTLRLARRGFYSACAACGKERWPEKAGIIVGVIRSMPRPSFRTGSSA
jgi:hypothetical protein